MVTFLICHCAGSLPQCSLVTDFLLWACIAVSDPEGMPDLVSLRSQVMTGALATAHCSTALHLLVLDAVSWFEALQTCYGIPGSPTLRLLFPVLAGMVSLTMLTPGQQT